ncbi:TPA: hypothetical protein ACGIZ8_001786 [Yersinia enterocolitica]
MLSKDKLKYPMEITDEQLRYLITAFENNMAEFYPVGREAEIARQLLSLREQLAELKALPPVAWRWRFCAQNVVTLDKDRAEKSNEMGLIILQSYSQLPNQQKYHAIFSQCW